MKRIDVLKVLSVQLLLVGCIAFPAYAEHFLGITIHTPNIIVQPEPVVVQPPPVVVVQPQPVYVQPQVVVPPPQPVYVQPPPMVVVQPQPVYAQPQPIIVQPQPVVVEPYYVIEGGVSILVDPEDYYYSDRGVYYHHQYLSDRDIVVTTVPSQYHFLHGRIDIGTVPQKHFRHNTSSHKSLFGREKRDKRH